MAQCDVQSGGKPERLSAVSLTDPELDAERIFTISQAHRSQKLESQMLDDVDQLSKRFPQSTWAEEGLFAAGNYYWVNMDRDRAAEFYRRALDVSRRQKRADRGLARGLDRLSGPQAGSGRFAGGLRPPVPHVELRPGCLVLAGPLLRTLGKSGSRAGFLSRRRRAISADLFWREGPPNACARSPKESAQRRSTQRNFFP